MDFEPAINDLYRKLNERAELIYEFVILYYNYIYTNHNYGYEQMFTMMEIHTLTHIEDNPGVTITELSKIWQKTKSAVSQTVKKLVDNGFVERKHKENNYKSVLLYVTEKGRQLSNVHKAYDVADITQTTGLLIAQCGEKDVEAFYRVLQAYTSLLKEN